MLKTIVIALNLFWLTKGFPQNHGGQQEVNTNHLNRYQHAAITSNDYCPPGFHLQNGQCIANSPQCEPGSVLINGMCYRQPLTSTCNECVNRGPVCPTGYQLINGFCQPIPPTTCGQPNCNIQPTQPPCAVNCPQPVQPIVQPCVNQCPPCVQQPCPACRECQRPEEIQQCPPGFVLSNGNCIQISCPEKTAFRGGQCNAVNTVNHVSENRHVVFNNNTIEQPVEVTINNKNVAYIRGNDGTSVSVAQQGQQAQQAAPVQGCSRGNCEPQIVYRQPAPVIAPRPSCCNSAGPCDYSRASYGCSRRFRRQKVESQVLKESSE